MASIVLSLPAAHSAAAASWDIVSLVAGMVAGREPPDDVVLLRTAKGHCPVRLRARARRTASLRRETPSLRRMLAT